MCVNCGVSSADDHLSVRLLAASYHNAVLCANIVGRDRCCGIGNLLAVYGNAALLDVSPRLALGRCKTCLNEQIEDIQSAVGEVVVRKRYCRNILAYELTTLVHGEEEAGKAKKGAEGLFGGAAPDMESAPEVKLLEEDYRDGKADILAILVRAGLATSRSDARQNVTQGGVTVDGEKVTDIATSYSKEDLENGILVKRGKKSFKKVVS